MDSVRNPRNVARWLNDYQHKHHIIGHVKLSTVIKPIDTKIDKKSYQQKKYNVCDVYK